MSPATRPPANFEQPPPDGEGDLDLYLERVGAVCIEMVVTREGEGAMPFVLDFSTQLIDDKDLYLGGDVNGLCVKPGYLPSLDAVRANPTAPSLYLEQRARLPVVEDTIRRVQQAFSNGDFSLLDGQVEIYIKSDNHWEADTYFNSRSQEDQYRVVEAWHKRLVAEREALSIRPHYWVQRTDRNKSSRFYYQVCTDTASDPASNNSNAAATTTALPAFTNALSEDERLELELYRAVNAPRTPADDDSGASRSRSPRGSLDTADRQHVDGLSVQRAGTVAHSPHPDWMSPPTSAGLPFVPNDRTPPYQSLDHLQDDSILPSTELTDTDRDVLKDLDRTSENTSSDSEQDMTDTGSDIESGGEAPGLDHGPDSMRDHEQDSEGAGVATPRISLLEAYFQVRNDMGSLYNENTKLRHEITSLEDLVHVEVFGVGTPAIFKAKMTTVQATSANMHEGVTVRAST